VDVDGSEQAQPFSLSEADARVNGLRLGGALIDTLLLTGVFIAVSVISGQSSHTATHADGAHGATFQVGLHGGPLFIFLGIFLLYYWVLESLFGRTLGKVVTGLRVIDRAGRTPSPGRAAIRTLGRIIDALPVFYLLGLVVMLGGGLPSRRVGDRLAGTAVVRG
jgi:uncharacterized RDD family membrane protein YckC